MLAVLVLRAEFTQPRDPAGMEFGMALGGSAVAGSISWGTYFLYMQVGLGMSADKYHPLVRDIGQGVIYGTGYGLLIPLGAYTGVQSMALFGFDARPRWGSILGAYVGSALAVPAAYYVLDTFTVPRVLLTLASYTLLPAAGAWVGHRLMPKPVFEYESESSVPHIILPYFAYADSRFSAGFAMSF